LVRVYQGGVKGEPWYDLRIGVTRRNQAHLLRINHDIDRIPYGQRHLCSHHETDTIQGDVIPMELDDCDGSFVVPIHQHDSPDPSVPSLLAAAKPTGFKVNGFCGNGEVNPVSDVRCAPCRRIGLPPYAQICPFTNTNA
jgi:hypothetical protein